MMVGAPPLPACMRACRVVDHVELPPWAPDPLAFLALQRAALESPCVSRALHRWVDLIFGWQQRGEAAVVSKEALTKSLSLFFSPPPLPGGHCRPTSRMPASPLIPS